MARVIPAEGDEKTIVILAGERGLKQLQLHIGGFVARIGLGDQEMWVDEDGLPKRLPVNRTATSIAGQLIVGTVILCKKGEWKQ